MPVLYAVDNANMLHRSGTDEHVEAVLVYPETRSRLTTLEVDDVACQCDSSVERPGGPTRTLATSLRVQTVMSQRLLELDGHSVVVTDPDRRLHGDAGPTKMEVMAYYIKAASRLMPFLRGRPTSTVFRPDESTQEFRFARVAPPGCPGRFATYRLAGVDGSQLERHLTVPDAGALEALVDYGCLSFHPWSSMAVAAQRPSQMVFNLDPEAIAFREVRNAALLLRDLLGVCGLAAWVKTSGGRGLHLLVPVRDASFDDTRVGADMIVRRALRREPTLFSRDPRRARRRGRILIDTSRNQRGATLVAPYSVAASGLVSALLEWDELLHPVYPDDFDLDRVVAREHADLKNQAAFFAADQSLTSLLRRARRRSSGDGRRRDHQEGQWLLGDTAAAVSDEAQWLQAKRGRLREDAEVTRIESRNVRYRAEKVREERWRLEGGPR
jgi:DNA ligase D-like protein (predicted polymerase)